MTEQLKAIIETRELVEEEVAKGRKRHKWCITNCPLCTHFDATDCRGCPFFILVGGMFGCERFAYRHFLATGDIPIEYVLSFLIDLEDCYRRMEK